MDVGVLAEQAVHDLKTRLSAQDELAVVRPAGPPVDKSADDALVAAFDLLAAADGWGKLAWERVSRNPSDDAAARELCRSLEHAARLHPGLAAQLATACGDHVGVPSPR
ncbi:hypothetical protein ACIB24_12325 [Spongisporangium articulatum]|uniref:Uncharacterized protein n=1 Tax=Spongisporangium articulatum TaxID=3362603 RepID=A0ABW8ANC7_9ACTN